MIYREPGPLAKRHLPPYVLKGAAVKKHGASLKTRIDTVRSGEIAAALDRHGGNVSATARDLKMSTRNLWRDIRKFGIQLS